MPRARRSASSTSRRRTTSSGCPRTRSGCWRSTTSGPTSCCPSFRYNEARSFIAGGLQDFSISRAGQPWGIPLPWDESQVAYVWADALVNYLSALSYARPGEDLVPVYWPVARHMLGKGILRFHCVFWPAMLLSAGYEVPQQLFAHGHLLMGEQKMSKSLGNVIDPVPLVERLRNRSRPVLGNSLCDLRA